MNPRYALTALRAGHRCEYCHAPELIFNFPFEVEHIVPLARQGPDEAGNWALACRSCNLRKGSQVSGLDPQTQAEVSLVHPRRDRWQQHFRFNAKTGELEGLTKRGRATVARLEVNSEAQVAARKQWARLGLFP